MASPMTAAASLMLRSRCPSSSRASFHLKVKRDQRRRVAEVARGDHRHFDVRPERTGGRVPGSDGLSLRQRVLHEVANAQVQGVQTLDAIEALL